MPFYFFPFLFPLSRDCLYIEVSGFLGNGKDVGFYWCYGEFILSYTSQTGMN